VGWVWVADSVVYAIHEAALARPHNLNAYDEKADAAAFAAAYAFGLARNHPFLDGNKRTSFVVMELFLNLNGWILNANDEKCISRMLSLAAGSLSEKALAAWLRDHIGR
jgi:death on curing protein